VWRGAVPDPSNPGDSDHYRDSVTFYRYSDDAYAAFEDATDADNFGGRA